MKSGSLLVNEIFYSIQGESTYAGQPCVFVRLTGCNLRCNYCDTEYSFYEGRTMAIAEIVRQVLVHGCNLVEVTGGEPLLQANVQELIAKLLGAGLTVMVETSGAVEVSWLDPRVVKIMDLKCPGSGEEHRNLWQNLAWLTPRDEIKFVLSDRVDYEWAREVIRKHDLPGRVNAVLMSCAFGRLAPLKLAQWILEDRLPVRLQLQLHKYIWPPDTRGV
jgi:7-carboxy-7-deazaguanine synthase